MADEYGIFTFTKSDDCILDEGALIQTLNQFKWDCSIGKWTYDGNDIYHKEYVAQYPTVYPCKIINLLFYCEETKRSYAKTSASNMSDQDWENLIDYESEDCELDELKNQIMKHIKLGWIEIAFSSNENRRYVRFGSMRVEAAGSVTRKIMVSGPSSGSYFVIESA
jgi:hypothetical protein